MKRRRLELAEGADGAIRCAATTHGFKLKSYSASQAVVWRRRKASAASSPVSR